MDAPIVYVEYSPLSSYLVTFNLKGNTTEDSVKANSTSQARQIIKDRYDGVTIQIISVRKV